MAVQGEIIYGLEHELAEQRLASAPGVEEVFNMYGPDAEDVPVDLDEVEKAIQEPVVHAETGAILVEPTTSELDTPRIRFGKWVVSTQASWRERTRDSQASHQERVEARAQVKVKRATERATRRPIQRWNVGLSRLAMVDQEIF